MSHMLMLALAAGTSLAAGAVAQAETTPGPYVGLSLAYSVPADQDIDGVDTPFGRQPGGYMSSDPGAGVTFSAGWRFDNRIRVEVEYSYRRSDLDRGSAGGALRNAATTGHLRQSSIFLNGYYDFAKVEQGPARGISPYAGAGIGVTHMNWDNARTSNSDEVAWHDTSDDATAAQIMVGFAYELPQAPNIVLTAELRHTRLLESITFDGDILVNPRRGAFPISTDVTDKGRTDLLIGIRRQF
ncbi:Opacity protein [Paracoccus halophilus]|uniref:Opacity protein n=1 Tax=Paracoccus halophilus TaxID=376733 RepID=A0A099EZ99_9RHOB|nr:porin family protein [Paracoccus halophilus]KGJ03780.1 hypothetical protein IT41_12630 [Paracoccus halophilus]SFA56827.1 Opacity protein [Paracoccus halophilus]